ncbi:uncharacterized protein [Acropora muricata]|uniref:uncharacterized protein n=1 Tax=Acropora muricata TaxID=159855 RepID=UPI0034E3BDDC
MISLLSKGKKHQGAKRHFPKPLLFETLDIGLTTGTSKSLEVSAEEKEDLQASSRECPTSFGRCMFVKLQEKRMNINFEGREVQYMIKVKQTRMSLHERCSG